MFDNSLFRKTWIDQCSKQNVNCKYTHIIQDVILFGLQ